MLFKFGKFWKTTTFVIGSWLVYGLWGYEFAMITILSLILASCYKEKQKFI
jgi:hypothetical protein|tara:strand:+ start:2015 stop:2167 length:153 start_codon:yes stop_codon:yes gene_type:complete